MTEARPSGRAKRVRVVVTCTQRKRHPIPRELCLRHITGVRTFTRLRAWTERLASSPAPTSPAADLYAGEHWGVARRLPGVASAGTDVELWVCSAGYGLIPSTAAIRPYSATFSPGSPDSVPGGAEDAAAWWDALCDWEGPMAGPRSIAGLLAEDPKTRVLLCLSATYLRACGDDITQCLDQDGRLSIISAGTKTHPDLQGWVLPADARLQAALGGTRQALNVRIAEHLLGLGLTDHEEMAEALAKLLVDQPPLPRYGRRPASDSEVRTFIRTCLKADPSATHSRLLRQFRDDGRACEQSRFSDLFWAEARRVR